MNSLDVLWFSFDFLEGFLLVDCLSLFAFPKVELLLT